MISEEQKNMQENKRRISLISEFIILLVFVLLITLILNRFSKNTYTNIVESSTQKDVKAENEAYIKKIKKEYGIRIVYGEESKNLVESVNASIQLNDESIHHNLIEIEQELKKYPEEVFQIFKTYKYPLKLVLLDTFHNNNLALTSRSGLNDLKIFISNNSKFAKSFHHEMYHVLEYYMADTHKFLYKSWYRYNPSDFQYVADIKLLDQQYVYMKETEKTKEGNLPEKIMNPYFVTLYAKTSEREDRAEIFSEIMILKSKSKYLAKGQNILNKAMYMDETIKECITVKDFYYSKYVK